MTIRARVAGMLMAGGLAAAAQQPGQTSPRLDVTTINENRSIERSLAPGDEHRYAIALGADEYVRLLVTRRHVDAIVDTYDAEGRPLAQYRNQRLGALAELVEGGRRAQTSGLEHAAHRPICPEINNRPAGAPVNVPRRNWGWPLSPLGVVPA